MIAALQLAAGFVLLLFGAEYLVRGAVSLARRLQVSPMVIGMTIVAYGTTAPELVVSLQAAIDGSPGIAVGNVVGSNIANILLILGVSAAIAPIAANPRALARDGAVTLGAALLFVALALSGNIARWQGILMVAALLVFSGYAYYAERRKKGIPAEVAEEFEEGPRSAWLALLAVIGGVAAVIVGARLLVAGAITAARVLGVAEEVIGLTVVAVGTSLPELATAVVAALRRHSDIALGNVLGANIYNLLAIMGLVSAVAPLDVPAQILRFDLWFMLAATVALLLSILLRRGIGRPTAILFLAAFVGYSWLQYYGVAALFG